MTAAANRLLDDGFNLIVPFDADEFWDFKPGELECIASPAIDLLLVGRWVNFVQAKEVETSSHESLRQVAYRAERLADADPDSIKAFRRSFVCSSDRKVGFKTHRAVELARGQHFLAQETSAAYAREIEIFHLPFRAKSEISKRGLDYEPRRALVRSNPADSWQSAFHREVVLTGRSAELWAANSADETGHLTVGDERIPLVADHRLRNIFANAAGYLAEAV